MAGILAYFSPEFAKELQITGPVTAGSAILLGYAGAAIGDVLCGLLSQKLRSRKKAVMTFLVLSTVVSLIHPYFIRGGSPELFYGSRFLLGLGNGYVAVLVAWYAELFGTNLRVTAVSVLTNLIRASVIPLLVAFQTLGPRMGLVNSQWLMGGFSFGIALLSVWKMPETFLRNLEFTEM